MKKLLCWFTFFCIYQSICAQQVIEPKVIFGEFNLYELEMKSYDADSSADALYLYDSGNTSFELSGDEIYIRYTYHCRIKILKKSAYNKANVVLSLIQGGSDSEEVANNIKGFTYTLEDGEFKREELNKNDVFFDKKGESYQDVKFTLPNVKEGSVIEYTYTIDTPFSVSTRPRTWTFQNDSPTLWSKYQITIPAYFIYRRVISSYLPVTQNEYAHVKVDLGGFSTNGVTQNFVVQNAPAFRDEPFITTPLDYISKIEFELAKVNWPGVLKRDFSLDYEALTQTLLNDNALGGQIKRTKFLSDIARNIKSVAADSDAQLKAAHAYIHQHIKWNENYGLFSAGIKKALDNHTGSAADINLFLIALLREMGFDANPLILSTRGHGEIYEQFALINKFNYVVAHISKDSENMFLDATDEYLKIGVLPFDCLNQTGWLLLPEQAKLLAIIPKEKYAIDERVNLSINEAGELNGTILKSYDGYRKRNVKSSLKQLGQEKYLEEAQKNNPSWNIKSTTIYNTEEPEKPLTIKQEVGLNDYVTKSGNLMYLKPMLSEGHDENPLKAKRRNFPLDFAYPIEESYIATFELPKGYIIAEQPLDDEWTIQDDGGEFKYNITTNANTITVTSKIIFHKAIYQPQEYPEMKRFLDRIIGKHNEQIVLKRKE